MIMFSSSGGGVVACAGRPSSDFKRCTCRCILVVAVV